MSPKTIYQWGELSNPYTVGIWRKKVNFEGSNMGSPEIVHPVRLILQASMFRFKLFVLKGVPGYPENIIFTVETCTIGRSIL